MKLVSLKGKGKDHPDYLQWEQDIKDETTEDLALYLNIFSKIDDFEICTIIKVEMESRMDK